MTTRNHGSSAASIRSTFARKLSLEVLEERMLLATDFNLLRDINPVTLGSDPTNFVEVGGVLFFTANDGTTGYELWKSDGTEAGTVRVKDIRVSITGRGSDPSFLTNVGGTLYFQANDGTTGTELWKSDGTEAGTVRVKDIRAGAPGGYYGIYGHSSYPSYLTNVGGTLYFQANDGTSGFELWKSDGTEAGTVRVKDIRPGSGSDGPWDSFPDSLTNVGGTLYFTATDGTSGLELWKSDGTEAGTVLVKDIWAGDDDSWPLDLTNVGGTLYFQANDGTSGEELWKSDGTEAGTVRVKDIQAGNRGWGSDPSYLTNMGGTLYFEANDGTSGFELWKSDGTAAGTVLVKDIRPVYGQPSAPHYFTNVGGTLYFEANDGERGFELWKSDGTEAGTVLVKDIRPGTYISSSSLPSHFINVGGTLYFTADDGTSGTELWKSDGTEAGTVRVKDIRAGGYDSWPIYLTNVGGTLYFGADDGTSGLELWKSDGTEAGTVRVKDIRAGTSNSFPNYLTNVGGTLYFQANDGTSGYELWKSDGTEAGTVRVKDIRAGGYDSWPIYLTNVGGTFYFAANDGTSGRELWKSDGTEAGTVRVKDIRAGISSSGPGFLTNVGGTLYFQANDGTSGFELWKSDGTEAGTVRVKDFTEDSANGYPRFITEANGRLFVAATTAQYKEEIWVAYVGPGVSGDYNTNGLVDAADYVLWRKTLGSTTDLRANGNDTGPSAGIIDQADYAVWRNNFGAFLDDHGNSSVDARIIGVPETKAGAIQSSADVDWFHFTARTSSALQFHVTLSGLASAALRLIGSDGVTQLAADTDGGTASIGWTLTGGSTYYLEVSGIGGATGNYQLVISPDDHGDVAAFATPIAVHETKAGAIQSSADVDWFQFTATTSNALQFHVTLSGLASAALRLIGSDGVTQLAADTDGGTASIGWTPTVGSTYYLEVSGIGGATGNYQLVISPDDHGDVAAFATPIAAPSTTSGTIDPAGDRDWFSFSAVGGRKYQFETLGGGTLSDTTLTLYGTNGTTQIGFDNDSGPGLLSLLDWTAPASSTYYLDVSGFSGATGSYQLVISPDDYGDVAALATAVAVASTTSGTINPSSDSDWFSFAAVGGSKYRFETLGGGTLSDTTLTLYGTNGTTQIGFDNDSGAGLLSLLEWTAPASGTYYFAVRGDSTNTGTYSVRVGLGDDHGNAAAYATAVAVPSTTNGTISPAGDSDWFSFSAVNGTKYRLETFGDIFFGNTTVTLYGTDGTTQIGFDDDSGLGRLSLLEWAAPASGTYFFAVGGYSTYTGSYSVQLGLADDHGNAAAYATAVAVPSTTSGTISPGNFFGDSDWFSFSAVSGTKYRFETLIGGTLLDPTITLYGTDGVAEIGYDNDSGPDLLSLLEWTAPASGTYYFAVRGLSSSNLGTYQVQVSITAGSGTAFADEPLSLGSASALLLSSADVTLAHTDSRRATSLARPIHAPGWSASPFRDRRTQSHDAALAALGERADARNSRALRATDTLWQDGVSGIADSSTGDDSAFDCVFANTNTGELVATIARCRVPRGGSARR